MASPLVIQPSAKDTQLNNASKTTNYGTDDILHLRDRASYEMRDILEFDISELPVGATLSSATLELYYAGNTSNPPYVDPVGKTVWAYKLSRTDWVENQATWNIYKTGSNWTAAGGDYVTSSPAGGSTTVPVAADAWMSWNVLAIVQDAYGSSNAAEFLIKFETEAVEVEVDPSYLYFRSKDYATEALRPKLTIEYEEGSGAFYKRKSFRGYWPLGV